MSKKIKTSLELFSGAGGLALGLAQSGFHHLALVERDADSCDTLRANFSCAIQEGDVREQSFDDLVQPSLIAGGPPCQPFSLGGNHRAQNDSRDMFPEAIRVVRQFLPEVILFENVKGLLRKSFEGYFEYIIRSLENPTITRYEGDSWQDHDQRILQQSAQAKDSESYVVSFALLNAANYGVPQNRERVFIVGFRSDLGITWQPPEPTHSKDRLQWEQHVTGEYWDRHDLPPQTDPSKGDKLLAKYGLFEPELLPWRTVRDATGHLSAVDGGGPPDHIIRGGAKKYPGHTGSFIDWPAKTIKAGDHGVPGGENMVRDNDGSVRYFTVHEAKLIQTFPQDFEISGSWGESLRQIGNAVPVLLASAVGGSILSRL